MGKRKRSGGDPQTLGKCTECASIYPVQEIADGDLRPIRTDGGCECGADDFALLPDRS